VCLDISALSVYLDISALSLCLDIDALAVCLDIGALSVPTFINIIMRDLLVHCQCVCVSVQILLHSQGLDISAKFLQTVLQSRTVER